MGPEVLCPVFLAEFVDLKRIGQVMGDRLVDEYGLSGLEHLLRLLEMLTAVVCLKADDIDLSQQLVQSQNNLDAHAANLRQIFWIAIR